MLLTSSDTKRTLMYSCLQIPPREKWFQYVRRVYTTAINFHCITPLVKPPFCCTVSMLQVYFTHLCYVNFWAQEHHFIEKKILKFFIFSKSILWHPVIHTRVHFSINFTVHYWVHFRIKKLPQTKKFEKCKPWEHPRKVNCGRVYSMRTYWTQFSLGGICKQ